jgi:pyrroloquinoline-quinone synthase
MGPREFIEECYAFKREHAPQGAFMRKLVAGKCSRAELRRWAVDAHYYTEPAIPTIAAWLAHAPIVPSRDVHRFLARNLAGEMGYLGDAEHYQLYRQLLDGFGVTESELETYLPLPSTLGAAAALGYFCRSSFEEGLGAFGLAVEMQVPGRAVGAQVLYEALRDHYGLDARTIEYYAVHVEAEDEHGDNAMRAVELFAQTAEQQARVRRAFRWTLLAHTHMFEGFDRLLD